MKIIAFLQNQWVRNPDRVRKTYELHPEQRNRIIGLLLFMNYPRCCLTGRRLRVVFGEELCNSIVWEESSEQVGGKSSDCFAADPAHIRRAVAKHQPDIILHFGRIASEGLARALPDINQTVLLIPGPHPAARHGTVVDELMEMAAKLRTSIKEMTAARAQYAEEDRRHA